jgi:hypothetical protein
MQTFLSFELDLFSRARLYSFLTTRTRRVRSSLPPGLGAIHARVSVVTPRWHP